MPFSHPEPGVIHLVIPESGWDPADRSAFMQELTRSCEEGPTGVLLESNTKRVSPEGPNLMLGLFEALKERIVCLAVATDSTLLQLTLVSFRTAAKLRGVHFPIHASDDVSGMAEVVRAQVRERRGQLTAPSPERQPSAS